MHIDYGAGELLLRRVQVSQRVLPSVEARIRDYTDSVVKEKEALRALSDSEYQELRQRAKGNVALAAQVVRHGFRFLDADNAVRVFEATDYAIAGTRGLHRVGLIEEVDLRRVARIAALAAATAVRCGRTTDAIVEAYEEYDMSLGPDPDPKFMAKGDLYAWGRALCKEHLRAKLATLRGGLH